MNDSAKRGALRYWEKRRVLYNFLLLVVAFSFYGLRTAVSAGVGDTRYLTPTQVGLLFIGAAIAANVCYSFVYALEFFFGTTDASSKWIRIGRTVTLAAGTAFAAYLAVIVARDIGALEYSPSWLSDTAIQPFR